LFSRCFFHMASRNEVELKLIPFFCVVKPSTVVDLSSWKWVHVLNFDLMDGDFIWSLLNVYVVTFKSLKCCPHLSPSSHLINILCNNKQGQEQLQHSILFYHEVHESF
jgi:hypothetical protein